MTPLEDDEDDEHSSASSLGTGFASYFRTRLQLVSIETQEALLHLRAKVIPLVVALVCGVVVYLLLLATLISFLGKLLNHWTQSPFVSWEIPGLLVLILHALILFRMRKALTRPSETPLFEYSRAELERDREWIQDHTPKKKS